MSRLLPFIFAFIAPLVQAQPFLNLDFEVSDPLDNPKRWRVDAHAAEVALDTVVTYSGQRSLRIRSDGHPSGGWAGFAVNSFSAEALRGKNVRISVLARTDSLHEGWAGLYARVPRMITTEGSSPLGTTPWTLYAIEFDVAEDATTIDFGVVLAAEGTAWFDDLRVEVDGEPYGAPEYGPFVPDEEEVTWLRAHALPFEAPEHDGSHWNLRPALDLVGDARVVALGEGSHGTREFFETKDRLLRLLAEEADFTLFAIEADMAYARTADRYITTGEGDPEAAVRALQSWPWETEEVVEMVAWMRRYNERAAAEGRPLLRFYGLEGLWPGEAVRSLRPFFEAHDPAYTDTLEEAWETIRSVRKAELEAARSGGALPDFTPWQEAAQGLLDYIESQRAQYLRTGVLPSEVTWALRYARLLRQAAEQRMGLLSRDEIMARNALHLLDERPGERLVIWGHNAHVSEAAEDEAMGYHLAEALGDGVVTFGFTFHKGAYTARDPEAGWALGAHEVVPSDGGTAEWALHLVGEPRFLLDLRAASADDPASAWLTGEVPFRDIGSSAAPYNFIPEVLTETFDVLVYFERSHPTRPLPPLKEGGP